MHLDVVDLRDFYASPVGQMVARHLAPVVSVARPHRRRHARARLRLRHALSRRDRQGGAGARLHAGGAGGDRLAAERGSAGSATALVEEDSLPLPDSSIDLVILVHALEMSDAPERADGGASPRADRAAAGSSSSCRTARGRGRAPTSRPSASAGPIRAGSSGSLFAEVGLRGGDLDDGAAHGAGHRGGRCSARRARSTGSGGSSGRPSPA